MTWQPPDDFGEPFAVTVTYDPDSIDDGQAFLASLTEQGADVVELCSLGHRAAREIVASYQAGASRSQPPD